MDKQNEIQMLNDEIVSLMRKSESLSGDERKKLQSQILLKMIQCDRMDDQNYKLVPTSLQMCKTTSIPTNKIDDVTDIQFNKKKLPLQKIETNELCFFYGNFEINHIRNDLIIRNVHIKFKFNDELTDEEKELFLCSKFSFEIYTYRREFCEYVGCIGSELYLLETLFNKKYNLTKIYPIMFQGDIRCRINSLSFTVHKNIFNKINSVNIKYEYSCKNIITEVQLFCSRIFGRIFKPDTFIIAMFKNTENLINEVILKNDKKIVKVTNYKLKNYIIYIQLDNEDYIDCDELNIFDENNNKIKIIECYITSVRKDIT